VCGPAAASSSHHVSTLLSGVLFGEISWPSNSLSTALSKLSFGSTPNALIVKIENQGHRHSKRSMAFRRLLLAKASACGIPRYAELARPLVWCIVLNARREHRFSINKDMTVGRNNKLTNQPKTYPSQRLQHIKP
jgi:hypothetical protein